MWKEKEFLEELELAGIDTVLFMGSGYHFEDYRVGQEFYFSYAYWGVLARQKAPDCFRHVLSSLKSNNINPFDRYKLIRKYKYEKNKIYGFMQRNENILIKNLRTKEVKDVTRNNYLLDSFYYCIMCEPV